MVGLNDLRGLLSTYDSMILLLFAEDGRSFALEQESCDMDPRKRVLTSHTPGSCDSFSNCQD